MFTDSQSCIKIVENQKFGFKTKHIDTRYKFIQALAANEEIVLKYCSTDSNVADMMTKPLSAAKLQRHRATAGII